MSVVSRPCRSTHQKRLAASSLESPSRSMAPQIWSAAPMPAVPAPKITTRWLRSGVPELVFLDEPTTGFDPSARHHAWGVIANLRELGKTIFLTTHYMDEAQALADHVAVIVAGQIVAEGTPDTLGGRDRALSEIAFALPAGGSL